ncbi:MAG TPA: hypothetical protein VFG87_26040 [Amycolatopsis sp.]|nr:hypothetical protein [Amycolatopsis sp.]
MPTCMGLLTGRFGLDLSFRLVAVAFTGCAAVLAVLALRLFAPEADSLAGREKVPVGDREA